MNGSTMRVGATLAAVAVLVFGAPLAASAHIKVSPNTAAAGDDIALTFRVPNESASAGTVKVEIDLPTKTPFAGAEYEPVPGWTAEVVTQKLDNPINNDGVEITEAPSKVIFTANTGTQIKAGQFQEFVIALDVTPDTGSVEFPTIQTYSDASVVKWTDKTPASGDEPENPAPTLYINDAPPAAEGSGVTVSATPTGSESATATSALVLGSAGLAVGVIALVLAIFAFARSRRRGESPRV
jgi:uncharacterized protein YcnI